MSEKRTKEQKMINPLDALKTLAPFSGEEGKRINLIIRGTLEEIEKLRAELSDSEFAVKEHEKTKHKLSLEWAAHKKEISELKAESEWRCILSAPKDGLEFLGRTDEGVVQIIKRNKHLNIWIVGSGKESYRIMTLWQPMPHDPK